MFGVLVMHRALRGLGHRGGSKIWLDQELYLEGAGVPVVSMCTRLVPGVVHQDLEPVQAVEPAGVTIGDQDSG